MEQIDLQVVSILSHNPDLNLNFVLNLMLEILVHLKMHVVIWERSRPGL